MNTFSRSFITVCLALPALLCLAPTVVAAEIAVASTADLALAIESARNGDIIRLSGDITLDERLPKITADITIEGDGFTISGAGEFSILCVGEGANVTLNHLNLIDGRADYCVAWDDNHVPYAQDCPDDDKRSVGGAILNIGGVVTVNSSSFRDNMADGFGGAISSDLGSLSITGSDFRDNRADYSGGAIYFSEGTVSIRDSQFSSNEASAGGALISTGSKVTIIGGSFSGNTSVESGAILNTRFSEVTIAKSRFSGNSADYGGGAIGNWGALSIGDSVFTGNRSADDGGAISSGGDPELAVNGCSFIDNIAEGYGGAISMNAWDKAQSITNSSFSGNRAGEWGGGLYLRWGAVTLTHLTMTDNYASRGGGIYVGDEGHGGDVILRNSLIAGSEGGDCVFQEYAEMKENAGNFIADGTCGPALGGDPGLAEIIEPEDGSPPFVPLDADSRAIDAADSNYCPALDQRGSPRPHGAGCDIGAYEYTG